jgi:WD40 repeat protein
MTPQQYERLCELFDRVLAQPADGRAAFLHEVGAADPALRAELEGMLAEDQKARGEQLFQGPCPVNAKALLPGEPPTVPGAPPAAEPDDALVGRRVGPYLIEQRVGGGGMGTVYRALREGDYQQRVAVKVIRPGLDNGEVLRRFRTERQVLAELGHAHIARLLDGGSTDDGRPYFVMEYIDGEPLDRYCDGRRLGTRGQVELLLAVCGAVRYAHGRGVLHRDLKPDNVLVTADGTPKVTDFGLAKRLVSEPAEGSPTQSGAVLGTPSYMAPEQAAGKPGAVGPATDVYALGAVLYELLTGRPPFRAATPLDTLLQVLETEPVPPSRLHPKLARDLETICLKCLQKDPVKRYASVAALADDLRRFLAGEPIQARPVGAVERLGRWCRRHPARAAAVGLAGVALLAVVALAVGAAFTAQLHKEQQRTRDALETAERYRAQLALERGVALGGQGDAARGLLWLGHSLEIAPVHDADLRWEIRANLAGLRHLVHPLRAVLPHPGITRGVAFSPDGELILTGCWDNTARLWKTSTAEPFGQPWPHPDRVNAVAFSPVGRIAATACRGGTVWLWDPDTGRPLDREPMRHQDTVWSVAFSADGKTLLTGSRDKTARLWDVATGKPIGDPLPHRGDVFVVAFCPPDGKSVVTAGEGKAPRIWEVGGTGPPRDALWGHADLWVTALAFSPDGKTVLTGSDAGTAQRWDVGTGDPRGPPGLHPLGVWAVAFSHDGKTFATGGRDGIARLWETATGKPLGAPLRHQDDVAGLAFSPDGRSVLTASTDQTARLWDVSPAQSLGTPLPHDGYVLAAVFSPDGKLVLTSSQDKTARLWDAQTGKEVLDQPVRHKGFALAAAFSPDGRTFATSSSEIEFAAGVWDTATGRRKAGPLRHGGLIRALAFSTDGRTLLTGSRDKTAKLWDAGTGEWRHTLQHDDDVWAVAFSPADDGKTVVTASEDTTARLWETATGKLLSTLRHQAGVNAVAFSRDGQRVLTGSTDRTARLWNATTGKELWDQTLRHQDFVNDVAFNPNGQTVVTTSSDWTARLWDAATRRPVGQPMQHQGPVNKVAFSPKGQTLVTGSQDATARLWDSATGKPLSIPLRHDGPVVSVAFSPDGRTVLTGSWKKAQLWKPPAPVEGEVERIVLWTQVMTGLELDADSVARVLDAPTWQERHRRLDELGGPPPS